MKKMVYQFDLRLAERLKLGGPSLGRSPDAHKQRRLDNKIKSNFSRKIRVDTIFERGQGPALFFCRAFCFRALCTNIPKIFADIPERHAGLTQSDRAKF